MELHHNIFDYTDGGAITVNPTSSDRSNMPVLTNWNFTYNENLNALGAGVFALYELYFYALLPMTLTVTNCKFENNKSGTAGAI